MIFQIRLFNIIKKIIIIIINKKMINKNWKKLFIYYNIAKSNKCFIISKLEKFKNKVK